MTLHLARGLFLAAACGVCTLAAVSWWEPGLTLVSSGDSPGYQPLAHGQVVTQHVRGNADPQGLLMLFGLVQGMRG